MADTPEHNATSLSKEVEAEVSARVAKVMDLLRHELRTPIGSVVTLCELVQINEKETHLDPKTRSYLEGMRQSAETALSILHAISGSNDSCSVAAMAQNNAAITPFSLASFLQTVQNYHGEKAMSKGLDFAFHMDANLPDYILAPMTSWRQIIDNVLNNAVKFTQSGAIGFKIELEEDFVVFTISDTGSGIAKHEQAAMFEAFSRSETARAYEGQGIGLALVKGLISQCQGALAMRSELGKGTDFQIKLPFETVLQPAVSAEKTEPTPQETQRKRILVVEDNAINRMLIEALLDKFGHAITMAQSGEEAIRLCALETFDLVLMDIEMPGGMNGFETARALRIYESASQTPILALSAHDGAETEKLAREHTMCGLVSKPLSARNLNAAIKSALLQARKKRA